MSPHTHAHLVSEEEEEVVGVVAATREIANPIVLKVERFVISGVLGLYS